MQVAEEKDMETAFSYFKEAATGSVDVKQRSRALKYMLLAKLMVNKYVMCFILVHYKKYFLNDVYVINSCKNITNLFLPKIQDKNLYISQLLLL